MVIFNTYNLYLKSHYKTSYYYIPKKLIKIRTFTVLRVQHHNTCSIVKTCYLTRPSFSKRFMKRLTAKTLTSIQKERLALHTQEFIQYNFHRPFQTKQELLQNNIRFMTDEGLPEDILNQTLTKSAFGRFSDSKKNISSLMVLSKKVIITDILEKSDFRFIVESQTASRFADSSDAIQQLILNSEHPKNPKNIAATICAGNRNKDISLQIYNNQSLYDMDIKSGNNANNTFSGILAQIPHINSNQPYYVTNEGLSLNNIQNQRINYFDELSDNNSENNIKDIYVRIKNINDLPLTIIQKNCLIQENIFKLISENLLQQRPSFYYAFVMKNQTILNKTFYEKLEPHINPHIFDNAKNAKNFMKQAIIAYTESIQDVSEIINKSKNGWMGTGFEHIANDLFK